ncbi:MAG: aminodeoxychorismate/anthranilate synthase component II [Bacteroidota bacterium]
MKILLLDNYDSFTYNLYHYIDSTGGFKVDVIRNDAVVLSNIHHYDAIVLSPGPGLPKESGLLMDAIQNYHSSKKIFGVCLGHQALAEYFGAKLFNLPEVLHGVQTPIKILNPKHYLFKDLPDIVEVGRYHSWVVNPIGLPDGLTVTAVDFDNQIMALSHKNFDICSVQFHPESIMTPYGMKMVRNWLNSF